MSDVKLSGEKGETKRCERKGGEWVRVREACSWRSVCSVLGSIHRGDGDGVQPVSVKEYISSVTLTRTRKTGEIVQTTWHQACVHTTNDPETITSQLRS